MAGLAAMSEEWLLLFKLEKLSFPPFIMLAAGLANGNCCNCCATDKVCCCCCGCSGGVNAVAAGLVCDVDDDEEAVELC